MIHVITHIERPSKGMIDSFRGIGTATVHEASGRKGAVSARIKPLFRGARLCGPAYTVQCHPGDNLMLHKALEVAEPGDVLVATVGGYEEAGYWGGLMATSAMAKGIGGLAIEGSVRDSAEMTKMGFPVFCCGISIRGTTKAILGLINHPVIFGGILIHPGDLILGDDDGMVVVGREECETVLEKSLKRIEAERVKSEKLRAGISSVELNQLGPVFEALGLRED